MIPTLLDRLQPQKQDKYCDWPLCGVEGSTGGVEGRTGGVVARALASYQYDPGSIQGLGALCELELVTVSLLSFRVFFWFPGFPHKH